MPNKNGKVMTQEEHKMLAELTLQNDERIEQLFDEVIELKLAAISAGWHLKNAQEWRVSAQERAKVAELQKIQRQRLRKSLGLI
ncbi:MAG: hypothetical protein KGL39_47000 [Patescibacteria group bacterium]|nr:hypothetical protein [Patescibacteria group bacterium]